MNISIMTYCYSRALASGALDLAGMLQEYARLGVPGVELVQAHAAGMPTAELRARVDDLGLTVPLLLVGAPVIDADPAKRAAAVEGMRPALDMALGLGAKQIMLLPSGDAGNASDAEVRRYICDGIARACEMVKGSGVQIIVENHGGAHRLRGRVEHMLEFADAHPDLGLCFDDGNFLLAGEEELAALEKLAGRVVHFHCKDWALSAEDGKGILAADGKRYVGAVIGEGVVPRTAAKKLQASGYTGFFSVEYEGAEDPVIATARAAANLKAILAA